MGSLIYSAVGTQRTMGAAFKPLDLTKLDPGMLMNVSGPAPSFAQAQAEAKTPLAQTLRAQLLEAMGLTPEDLQLMKKETRADLEGQIARHIHQEVASTPGARPGAALDVRA